MNKKNIIRYILVVFMLITISFVTAVSSKITKNFENEESPLYSIRKIESTNKEKVTFTSDYVGKGRVTIPFSRLEALNKIKRKHQYATRENCGPGNIFRTSLAFLLLSLIILPMLIIHAFFFTILYIVGGIEYKTSCMFIDTCNFNCPIVLSGDNQGVNSLQQKINDNPLFQKLIIEHPELIPKISERF